MPGSRRWAVKQKMDGWIFQAEHVRDELVNMANIYNEHHPDYANIMFTLAKHFDDAVGPLKSLKDII